MPAQSPPLSQCSATLSHCTNVLPYPHSFPLPHWQPATAGGAVCFAHFKFNFWFHLRTVCFSFFRVIVSGCENKLKILLCQLAQRGNNTARTPVGAGPGQARAQSIAQPWRVLFAPRRVLSDSFARWRASSTRGQFMRAYIINAKNILYTYRNVFFANPHTTFSQAK